MNKLIYLVLLMFISNTKKVFAQFGLSHEVGVVAGPVFMHTDYGSTYNYETILSNVGVGIGIVHYLSFFYDTECHCKKPYTYFSDHFKIRSELSYNKSSLGNFGGSADNSIQTTEAVQLRAMRGVSKNVNVGSLLEYYPLSLRDFDGRVGSFAPYIGIGVHFVWTNPEVSTTLGRFGDPLVTPAKYMNAFSNNSERILSFVGSAGTRYKIGNQHDISLDFKFQYFNSDNVDGLNPNQNIFNNPLNDGLLWINFGYIYYFY